MASSSKPFAGADSGSPGRALEAGKRGSPGRAVQAGIRGKRLRPIYTRRYSGGIPRGIAHLSNQRTFIYFCVTPERYASGIALDRFQSDIPAGSRSPAVHLTNQRFCFAVVMPLPVTGLAGSDAYLSHQKTRCRRV